MNPGPGARQAGDPDAPSAAQPPRIDAHHHLWDVETGAYSWPTPDLGAIYRTFTAADLAPLIERESISGTVLVQTVNTLADTDSMLGVAESVPWVRGVVGWVPLEDPMAAAGALDARAGSALRGIRHLAHHERDPDWLIRPRVLEGLREVGSRGLAFEVIGVFPGQLVHVPLLADRLPQVTLVIDHLGNPPFRRPGWQTWRLQLAAAARRPNVIAKLSGLTTAAGEGWTIDELQPAVDAALEAFGPDRLMFGSDWPVCLLFSSYTAYLGAIEGSIARLAADERASILGGTATRVYRLAERG